jgi:ketosteroid isomerase-like protein
MSEESTNPDLVELTRRIAETASRRDMDGIMAVFAPDVVWDGSPIGLETFEGQAAVRSFLEDWFVSYEEWEVRREEGEDFGNGVTFVAFSQKGRLVGSSGEVQLHYAAVSEWEDGKIARITNYRETDEARAAAERLAEERG